MAIGAAMAFLLQPPNKVIRDDGTAIAAIEARGFFQELKANLEIFTDWKLMVASTSMIKTLCSMC